MFNQLEHERRFKFIFQGLLILITLYVVSFFLLAHIIEPGALFKRVYFFTGGVLVEQDDDSIAKLTAIRIIFSHGVTVLAMVTSETCAHLMRPVSTINHPVCSPGFIVNSIPFFTLNFSIVLAIVVHVVAGVFFEYQVPYWLNISVTLIIILVTNKGARTHVASRVRRHIDNFTIGGNNNVVSIALVPLRSQTRDSPTLSTTTRSTVCPVAK